MLLGDSMNFRNVCVIAVAAMTLAACAAGQKQIDTSFTPAPGPFKLLLMKPDVEVGLLTAGGLVEPNKDWTEKAKASVFAALEKNNASRGGALIKFTDVESSPEQAQRNIDLENLHRAVASAVARHKYGPETLPTKKDKFDWTLGDQAQQLGSQTGSDYALFFYGRDSFSSGGRVALQIMGAIGCGFGLCLIPGGGQQFGYASLVDLKSGNIVWFNFNAKASGDIRTPEGAATMIDGLLQSMPLGPKAPKASK